jgi:hypothetical protein
VDQDEIILVVVNISDQTINDLTLTLKDAGLTDQTYKAKTLLGDGQVQDLQVTGGGFQDYKPIEELGPRTTLIVKFNP